MSTPLVRFGAFADAHYAERVYGDRHCPDSADKLRQCVDGLNAAAPDFAVCLGDLIDSAADLRTEKGFASTMTGVFAGFAGPRHWVVGNHDVQALSKAEFLRLCGASEPAHYSFDVRAAHFVVLDTNCHEDGGDFCRGDFSWDRAWVGPQQIEWLADDLAAAADRPAIVLTHGNLDHRLWQGELDPHVTRDAADVRAALEHAGNVRAVVQAHCHSGGYAVQNGIPYVTLKAMVVEPGLDNNAYALLSLWDDGRLEVEGAGRQDSYTATAGEGG